MTTYHPMVRLSTGVLAVAVLLALPASAAATPPVLLTAGHEARHPVVTFSAPRANPVAVYIASKPDRATDGAFFAENIVTLDILTANEIQTGRWLSESQLEAGTYWVNLRASPDFAACWDYERFRGLDPACADGYSNVLQLQIPRGPVSYEWKFIRPFAGSVPAGYVYRGERLLIQVPARGLPAGERRGYQLCALKPRREVCRRDSFTGPALRTREWRILPGEGRNGRYTWFVRVNRRTVLRRSLRMYE